MNLLVSSLREFKFTEFDVKLEFDSNSRLEIVQCEVLAELEPEHIDWQQHTLLHQQKALSAGLIWAPKAPLCAGLVWAPRPRLASVLVWSGL